MSETKNKIINSVLEILVEENYQDLTMSNIAFKLNISRQALYKHFSSKDEIIKYGLSHDLDIMILNIDDIKNNNEKIDYFYNKCKSNHVKIDIYFRTDLHSITNKILTNYVETHFNKILNIENISKIEADINVSVFITLMRNVICTNFEVTLNEFKQILRKYYGKY